MLRRILNSLLSIPRICITTDYNLPTQGYICKVYEAEAPATLTGKQFFESGSSIIINLDDGSILKCLKVRHWTEYHKVILGKNRAIDEVASSFLMKKIGLKVPVINYHGIFSNLFQKRAFTSFYSMVKIPENYQPGNLIFSQLTEEARENLISRLSLDLNTLMQHSLVYSDLSLRNVLVNEDGDYYWIDTQVKFYKNSNKFKSKFNTSLYRFIDESSLSINLNQKSQLKEKLSAK